MFLKRFKKNIFIGLAFIFAFSYGCVKTRGIDEILQVSEPVPEGKRDWIGKVVKVSVSKLRSFDNSIDMYCKVPYGYISKMVKDDCNNIRWEIVFEVPFKIKETHYKLDIIDASTDILFNKKRKSATATYIDKIWVLDEEEPLSVFEFDKSANQVIQEANRLKGKDFWAREELIAAVNFKESNIRDLYTQVDTYSIFSDDSCSELNKKFFGKIEKLEKVTFEGLELKVLPYYVENYLSRLPDGSPEKEKRELGLDFVKYMLKFRKKDGTLVYRIYGLLESSESKALTHLRDTGGEIKYLINDFHLNKPVSHNWPRDVLEAIKKGGVIVGMTQEQVLISIGSPSTRNRTTGEGGVTEQWVYEQPFYDSRRPGALYLYFKDKVVTSIQVVQ